MSAPATDRAKLIVVVDANVIVRDRRLVGGEWKLLLDLAIKGRIELRVPETVVREAVGAYRRELVRVEREVMRLERDLRRLGLGNRDDLPTLDVDNATREYGSSLRNRLEAAAVVSPAPAVGHLDLVDRAIDRKRPFSDSGDGYRDALLWMYVLESVGDDPVVLISDDARAFGEGDSLHPALEAEVTERGSRGGVRWLRSLSDLLADPAMPTRSDLSLQAARLLSVGKLRRALESKLEEAVVDWRLSSGELPRWYTDPRITGLGRFAPAQIESAHSFGDDEVLVHGVVRAQAKIIGCAGAHDPLPLERTFDPDLYRIIGPADDDRDDVVVDAELQVSVWFVAEFLPPDEIADVNVVDLDVER